MAFLNEIDWSCNTNWEMRAAYTQFLLDLTEIGCRFDSSGSG
jgi:hypothetical protein